MTDLVRYSRAGDVFHYRWAARRCLRMINPNSKIKNIVIEGSNDPDLLGEYVMDATEYSESVNRSNEDIAYFQFKHTTTKDDQCFQPNELEKTIKGFAERFLEHRKNPKNNLGSVKFSIITNHPINNDFKHDILKIGTGRNASTKNKNKLEKDTSLIDQNLQEFCAALELIDNEGNYANQKYELQLEMSEFFAGQIEHTELNDIIALIQEKVLPDSDGKIYPK